MKCNLVPFFHVNVLLLAFSPFMQLSAATLMRLKAKRTAVSFCVPGVMMVKHVLDGVKSFYSTVQNLRLSQKMQKCCKLRMTSEFIKLNLSIKKGKILQCAVNSDKLN